MAKTTSRNTTSAPKKSTKLRTRSQTPEAEPSTTSQSKTIPKPHFETPATGPQTTKAARCFYLLRQSGGATLQELMAATGWQAHSVRGFLSGTVRRKMGLALASTSGEGKVRRYHLTGEAA
jgi:hypothetical protein